MDILKFLKINIKHESRQLKKLSRECPEKYAKKKAQVLALKKQYRRLKPTKVIHLPIVQERSKLDVFYENIMKQNQTWN